MATEFRLMNSLRPSSPLRLRPYSDLHLEFGVDDTFLSCLSDDGADIVVLAGDVHRGDKGVQWAIERFACPVVYVLGNHEPYGHDLDDSIASCRDSARGSNVVVLENEEVVFGGVRFLGCTFWTDFASNGAERVENAKTTARSLLPDFEVISQSNHPLTPDDVICRHGQSKSWLNARLATPSLGELLSSPIFRHTQTPCMADIQRIATFGLISVRKSRSYFHTRSMSGSADIPTGPFSQLLDRLVSFQIKEGSRASRSRGNRRLSSRI